MAFLMLFFVWFPANYCGPPGEYREWEECESESEKAEIVGHIGGTAHDGGSWTAGRRIQDNLGENIGAGCSSNGRAIRSTPDRCGFDSRQPLTEIQPIRRQTMKHTVRIDGYEPIEVELKPVQPPRPEPKFKKGDWFVSGPNDCRRTFHVTGNPEWREAGEYWNCPGTDSQHAFVDSFSENCLYRAWLPIPPWPDKVDAGWELTGEVRKVAEGEPFVSLSDKARPGEVVVRKGDRTYQPTGEYSGSYSFKSNSAEMFCGRRWIVRKAQPVIPDRTGQWLLRGTSDIVEVIGKCGSVQPWTSSHPIRWYPSGHRDGLSEGSIQNGWKQIPPKPTAIPDGYELTGKVINLQGQEDGTVCWHDSQPNSPLVHDFGFSFENYRWEMRKTKPARRLGFRIWEPGMKDDGRVMVRLVDGNPPDRVIVVAVDESGKKMTDGNLITLFGGGYAYTNPSVTKEIEIQRTGRGAIKINE